MSCPLALIKSLVSFSYWHLPCCEERLVLVTLSATSAQVRTSFCIPSPSPSIPGVTSSDICKALLCLCSYFYLNNIYHELQIFPGRCLYSYSIISWIIFLELSAICQSIHCSEVAEPECNVLNDTSKRRQIFISFYAIWCFYIANISHICHPLGKTYPCFFYHNCILGFNFSSMHYFAFSESFHF